MYRLLVDFNNIDDDPTTGQHDLVTGLRRSLTGPYPRIVRPGDRIRLHDDGEHEVEGDVTRVSDDGALISARMDRRTWGADGHIKVVQMIPGNRWGAWIETSELLESGWTEGGPQSQWHELPLALPPAA
jgi:hypothetical protein